MTNKFGIAVLQAIVGRDLSAEFEFHEVRKDGLFVKPVCDLPHHARNAGDEELHILRWCPAGDHVAALPFPFNANELATFMVYGAGYGIRERWRSSEDMEDRDALKNAHLTNSPLAIEALREALALLAQAEGKFPPPSQSAPWVDHEAIMRRQVVWLLSAQSAAAAQQDSGAVLSEDRGSHVKRAGLIANNLRRWPTVEQDLKYSSQNGLGAAAKDKGNHGWWWEAAALQWAHQRGKLKAAGGSLDELRRWGKPSVD